MGKDSLLKSTTKAEKDKKKKTAKRSVAAKTKKTKTGLKTKAAGQKKRAAKIAAPKKKTTVAKPKSPVKAKATARRRVPKKKAAKKSPPAEKKLILKKFDPWKPEKIFRVTADKKDLQTVSAPLFVSGQNEKETARIRQLLFKKFDLTPTPLKSDQAAAAEAIPEIAAEPPPPAEPDDSRPFTQKLDPAAKLLTFLITALVILCILIITASSSNRSNYYIRTADGAVEIWQGTFAPLGKERIIVLPGYEAPEPFKKVYTQNEISALVFNYYLDKADTLLEVTGMPDFEGIKLYLNMAQVYAITNEHKAAAASRLNSIDLMTYLYKADVAVSKGTISGFEDALVYLNRAAALKLDKNQAELVNKKIQFIKELLATRQAKPAQPDKKLNKPAVKQ